MSLNKPYKNLTNMTYYLSNLRCSKCRKTFLASQQQTFCQDCSAPLIAEYDLQSASRELDRDLLGTLPKGMWRWKDLLPVQNPDQIVSLGEGDAPLLHSIHLGPRLELANLFIKDESLNPTGTFKARGLAAAVSKANNLGIHKLIIPTAGNAGGAMAAYAARAGMQACVIMPSDTPRANVEECRIYGAEVILVEGLISDAARLAQIKTKEEGWFDLSTFKEPYRLEGKKIMGYELAEAFQWQLPDVIIYPTGGGTGLVGMWKAFDELEQLGWLERRERPRMVSVQASGCAPVVRAFENHALTCEFWENAQTLASGLRVPLSFADRLILQAIYDSKGCAIAVSDKEISQAQRELASVEGIFAAPEGAATLAALYKLIDSKWIQPEERIVLFNTGSGLKYL